MKTFVAGHRGLVGNALVKALSKTGVELLVRSREELDLTDQQATRRFFEAERPQRVYVAAAKVGGIHANDTYPAEFIYQNLMIEANVIEAAWRAGVERLLFLGSSCIYPRMAAQPMREEELLNGYLEPTNEAYAVAKITGIKLCESFNRQYGTDFRSVMPTNLYGPGDDFSTENSHVVPALIRKIHQAKTGNGIVEIWGTGAPRREFMHVDDLADACLFVMGLDKTVYNAIIDPRRSHVNVGVGSDVSIKKLAEIICFIADCPVKLKFDETKPDGPPQKLLDVSRLKQLGWQSKIGLKQGLRDTYKWYVESLMPSSASESTQSPQGFQSS